MVSPRWRAILGRRIMQMLEMCGAVDFPQLGPHEVRQYIALARRHFEEFSNEHQGIVIAIEEPDVSSAQEAIFLDVERTYIKVQAALAAQLARFEQPPSGAGSAQPPPKASKPKTM